MPSKSPVAGLKKTSEGRFRHLVVVASCLAWFCALSYGAEVPRVLPVGQTPADGRLEPLKDLDGYFPFVVPATREQWDIRAERVRRQLLVSLGLWPMPSREPLNAVVHGRIDRDNYTVEKAYFESMPGFYVTGSLYRPKGKEGKRPGVLCPHGHWSDGRFHDAGEDAVLKEIDQGAEQFEEGGRSPLQARCVQLARMGCVVFHYDMIGYADSLQIPSSIAHGFSKQRPEMNAVENWGLFSPQAEANSQSIMGLQTYSSIRALDFLCGLPDVDASRLGVTGASGGGTQTFILCAVDSRVTVAFPAVMVSTAMQGGCTCENACGVRIGTGNVEIAALFAPKPLGMSAANDWTKEMETKGFPELKQLYRLLGAPDNVMLHSRIEFGHNYNAPSRRAMYKWFNRQFKLGLREPIVDRDYKRLTQQEMSVWDDRHPKPEGGPEFERRLLRWWKVDADRQLAELTPRNAVSLTEFRKVVGGALDVVIGRGLPAADTVEFESTKEIDRGDYKLVLGLLRNRPEREELPVLFLQPRQRKGPVVIWLDPAGKTGLLGEDGGPKAELRRLLGAGVEVVGVDLLYQGEFLADGKPIEQTRRVENKREAAAYTFGYNHTLFAQRTEDVLSVIAWVNKRQPSPSSLALVGLDGAGLWAAAARAQARGAVHRAAIDTGGSRFGKILGIHDPGFLPGGAKYWDIPGMLAVAAPGELWLAGEGANVPSVVKASYQASGAADRVTLFGGPAEARRIAAIEWLLSQ
jgi:dienelactone hydrolase